MQMICKRFFSVYHIDNTFKIALNNFPLFVFGRTDISRQFFHIALMILSHEQQGDFSYFYRSSLSVCQIMNLGEFISTYLMQDACEASANALFEVFG